MTAKCLIVDDEPIARKGIEAYIEKTPYLECVVSLGSAHIALEYLKNNEIDILFLDIQMPDMTGLELMNVLSNPPQVIFTTAHREFALDGFELNAVDYLLKPISYNRFLKAVQKTLTLKVKTSSGKDYIFIKCDGLIVKILVDEILFIETAKDYIFIYPKEKIFDINFFATNSRKSSRI
ncbi:MAG: response regulator [Cellulophaga sp.]